MNLRVTLNCSLLGGSRIHQEITHFLEAVPGFKTRGVVEVQVFKRLLWKSVGK